MKKNLLVFSLLISMILFNVSASATIVQGTVGNGTYVDYEGTQISNTFGLDFNNDGFIDFALQDYVFDVTWTNTYIFFANAQNNIVTQGTFETGNWDAVQPLALGTSVGSNCNFGSEGDAMLIDMANNVPYLTSGTVSYIGFKIEINGSIHYGYAKVLLTGTCADGITTDWQAIYYESAPNTAILTGATASIDDNQLPLLSVFPNPTHSFLQVDLTRCDNIASVSLFDISGKLLYIHDATSSVITMDVRNLSEGLYFIRFDALDGTSSTTKFIKQ